MTIDPEALERFLDEVAEVGARFELRPLRELVADLRRHGQDPRARVVFVGEFSNGKSQVINSLLGDSILPASATPTTRVLTEVGYGEPPAVTLVTNDGLEETITPERFAALEAAEGYRRARVQAPVEWLREFVLVDTPGLTEPEDVAGEIVYEELPRADVIVFVLHAQAALKRTERLFLTERILKHDQAKILFLINQIDHLAPEDAAEVEAYLRRQLATVTPRPPVVLRYSALEALRGRLTNDAGLLDRANYPPVSRALTTDLAGDRRRLRQASTLARLAAAVTEARDRMAERRGTLQLSIEEIDERLGRLEQEEGRYRQRIDLVCERAGGHLDLIARHLETQLQSLRLRVDAELDRLTEGVSARDLRKQLPFYLEGLVKGFLEWQQPALEARMAALYEEIDRDISEAASESLAALDLQPGHIASALRTRAPNYDRTTQAARMLGLSGIIAIFVADLPLAAIMLAVSQALRVLGREKREAAEREQMLEAGKRAMRACLERAREELMRQMEEYKTRLFAAVREEGDARMADVVDSLKQARADHLGARAQEEGPARDWAAAQEALEDLGRRVERFEAALAQS